MVYLQGLSNMQNSRTFDYLSPIIGNPSYDRHIRHLAIGCIMRTLYKQEERVRFFSFVLYNFTLHWLTENKSRYDQLCLDWYFYHDKFSDFFFRRLLPFSGHYLEIPANL